MFEFGTRPVAIAEIEKPVDAPAVPAVKVWVLPIAVPVAAAPFAGPLPDPKRTWTVTPSLAVLLAIWPLTMMSALVVDAWEKVGAPELSPIITAVVLVVPVGLDGVPVDRVFTVERSVWTAELA